MHLNKVLNFSALAIKLFNRGTKLFQVIIIMNQSPFKFFVTRTMHPLLKLTHSVLFVMKGG